MKIGEFEVKGDRLMVSDPCYERDTWCQGIVEKVKPGTWVGSVVHTDKTGGWGRRVAVLRAEHKSVEGKYFLKHTTEIGKFEVGVDSGQAGIFDESRYQLEGKGEYGEDGTWYGEACKCTMPDDHRTNKDHPGAGILDLDGALGVVSSSGYGDGSYECEIERDEEGNAVVVEVVFIGEDEDEEEDEE